MICCLSRLILIAASAAVTYIQPATAQTPTVAITAIVEHPALEAVREGVRDELKARGFEEGKNLKIEYQNAQGNMGTAAQIARQFAGSAPSVIVPISTPSAQAVASATRSVPIVFAAVSDPVGAKLVPGPGPAATGTNITGVSDPIPVAAQLQLANEILPQARRVGMVYSPGEANMVLQVETARETAKKLGLTLIEAPALKSAEVQASARSLVGRVDFIYIPADNAVMAAFEAVMGVADRARLPVIAADEAGVSRGALASVGFNYYDSGRTAGAVVAQVLNGTSPGQIPWVISSGAAVALNTASARRLNLVIPEAVLKRAAKIVKE